MQKYLFQWLINYGQSQRKLVGGGPTAPILDIVDPNEPFVLETDASGDAIGAILMQGGRPIEFESKKLNRV